MTEILTDPGYITEFTNRGSKGRYTGGENVRFRKYLPEKIGGCQKIESDPFLGICRRMQDFKSLALEPYIALATNIRFYIFASGSLVNVTPQRDTGTLGTDPFATASGSSVITVTDAAHQCAIGDIVNFSGATASGTDAITIDGDYEVLSIPTSGTYTIDGGTSATATEAFGGSAVDYIYEINVGLAESSVGAGWGGGNWDEETWGTIRTNSGINLPLRTVSISRWGEDVIFNIRKGAIYFFDTSGGIIPTNPATLIASAPDTSECIVVSPEDRHLIALGAHDGANSDPMLVAWCSQEDFTDWTPSAINTAGDKRLEIGTRIMAGLYARNQILILTDQAVYSMVFIGYPEVFGITFKGKDCGLISPNAAVEQGDNVYWMSDSDFWIFDGAPSILPCDIRNYVYDNLNTAQQDKIYASLNSEFHEVWWICPHNDGGYFVVIYNWALKTFYYTELTNWGNPSVPRSAWIDKGEYSNKPISAGEDGYLWQQETGKDHGSDPLPIRLKRFYEEIGSGDDAVFTTTMIPDFKRLVGSIDLTFNGLRYPQPDDSDTLPDTTKGPYTLTSSTRKKNIRIRARQVNWVLESSGLGDDFRFGTMRINMNAAGKKG